MSLKFLSWADFSADALASSSSIYACSFFTTTAKNDDAYEHTYTNAYQDAQHKTVLCHSTVSTEIFNARFLTLQVYFTWMAVATVFLCIYYIGTRIFGSVYTLHSIVAIN